MSPICLQDVCGAWHVKAANVLHARSSVQQTVLLATAKGLTHVSA